MPGSYRLFLSGRSTCAYRGFISAKACTSGSNALDLWPVYNSTRQLINLVPASGKNVSIVGTNVTMVDVGRTAEGCANYIGVAAAAGQCSNTKVLLGTKASVGATAWEIQWVPGQPGCVYISNAARSASCLKRYLGASANCSSVTLGLFARFDASALTQWQLYKV